MKYIVGVSDMKACRGNGDMIVTHALGSCIGIAIHDPVAGVGGILHYMLPLSKVDPPKAQKNPFMFGDTGIPLLFREAYKLGAKKENLRVVMAGGAQVFEKKDFFDIGNRNIVIARKMFWRNGVMIAAEHVAGHIPRTLYLDVDTGESWFTSHGQRGDL
ncbi:MAG: chemotaxis protein CheD [Chitinivibrionales bacterium]|nr:chemotaxis protein CheD [Chitinivibrionales bacterium]